MQKTQFSPVIVLSIAALLFGGTMFAVWRLMPRLPQEAMEQSAGGGGEILAVGQQTFAKEVLQAEGPVLVDFWAPWCEPCRTLAPVVEKFAANEPGVKVVKVNIDDNPALADKYRVQAIPTLIFFADGKEVSRSVGVVDEANLIERFNEAK